ncbi:hypothetical protein EAO75_35545 [Streptomyces sp. uw30]|nr:hypothetical protein EAO75_35545 [Streptomyces sp. uw30]
MRYNAQRIWNHHGQNHSAVRLPQGPRIPPDRGTRGAGGSDECGGSAADALDAQREQALRTRSDDTIRCVHAALDAARPDDDSPSYAADHHVDHRTDRVRSDRCDRFGRHVDD